LVGGGDIIQGSVRGCRACQANCSRVADGRRPALAHFRHRRRLARSCTKVVGGCFMAARSTSLGVLQREHWISSHAKPPLMAWSMVGDGSIGAIGLIRSFHDSQSSLSACCSMASAFVRISADCAARMLVIARALPSSLAKALRSPPERGVGWYFGAIQHPSAQNGSAVPDGPKGRSNRRRRIVQRRWCRWHRRRGRELRRQLRRRYPCGRVECGSWRLR
jgi:hypothetical protein